jgi:DNA invertase Pin-like site-specific DNA recombinase
MTAPTIDLPRDGNVFTVTKFDRFARNMAEANETLTDLRGRGVLFGLGASVYDWNGPVGRLFLQTLAMVAEFEEREVEGQAAEAARARAALHPPPLRRRRRLSVRSGHRIQRRSLHHPLHHPRAERLTCDWVAFR